MIVDRPGDGASIEVTGVSKKFGTTAVLSGFSATFGGGVSLLVGPNGSGKSTLLRCMAGLCEFQAGQVSYALGRSAWTVGAANSRRGAGPVRGLVLLPQEAQLWSQWTVLENVWRPLADICGADRRAAVERAEHWLARFGVPRARWHARPYGFDLGGQARLSGGQHKKSLLARAFAMQPQALLLDEFDAFLDRASVRTVVDELSATYGAASGRLAIVTTHHPTAMSEVESRSVPL